MSAVIGYTAPHFLAMPSGYDSRPPDPPARLGRYAVVRRLGAGGMAEVFLARSRGAEGTDKLVVVKRILPAFAANARFRTMFVDEARVALRLNHPHVVQVYGFESDGPALLLVMEYVDGPDLAAVSHAVRARGEVIPPGLAAWIVRDAARGLHYAHERRDEDGTPLEIVHRDVSPGNVLLSYDGVVKLGDFGIAKARLVSGEDEGAIKGKFAYMSPEQARTEAVDRRADIYSLGVVLGEMLANRTLFPNVSSGADLLPRLRRGETPDIHAAAPGAPAELRAIVARMLAPDRAERFATAREVAHALTRFLRAQPEEWDAAALEQYLARAMARSSAPDAGHAAATATARGTSEVGLVGGADRGARGGGGSDGGGGVARGGDGLDAPTVAGGARGAGAGLRGSAAAAALTATPSRPPPPGSPLDPGALMRERVHVAVIVGRIVVPPTTVDTVDTRALYSLIESLAFKADATLERSDEEGRFTLVVGVVAPHVDHSLRAAQLALDIAEAAHTLALDQAPGGGGAVESAAAGGDTSAGRISIVPAGAPDVALGVARGVAACARGGDGTLLGFEVVDEAVSFAASLADIAQPAETLVTPGLYRLVRRAFVLGEHHALRGSPTRAWRLERTKTRAERERDVGAAHVALIGREPELAQLRAALAHVGERGQGQGLLVVGELGVGKSALVAAFAHAYESQGAVIRVPVSFGGRDRAYRCVAQILTEVLHVPDEHASDPAHLGSAIERAIEISAISSSAGQRAARRALRVAMGLDDDEAGSEAATVREVVLVLRRLLAARAVLGAIAVVIDGVELADRQSRAVLLELLRRPPAGPVLVVLVVRDDDPLVRDAGVIPTVLVPPLPDPARAALVAQRLSADEASPELVREVSAVAGGNPLMMLEVIEALSDRGRLELRADERGARAALAAAREGELPLPATLEQVLAARIDALPPEARALARWCALADAELPIDLLELLGGDEAPRAIGRLLADGILVRAHGRRDVLTFAHSALAKVARASIDPTQLAGMHARIAAALERGGAARGPGAAMIARHREAAGAIRPAARAYLECATALRIQSHDREALEAYARVLELTADAQDPEGHALRFAAHTGREEIWRGLGRARARRAEIVAMRAIALDAKDPRLIARALARQARYKLETNLGASGIERDVLAATRAARRAGELRTEAEAKRVLAVYLGRCGRYAEAIHAADEALAALETRSALAIPPGGTAEDGVRAARTVRVETLLAKGTLLWSTGEIAEALAVHAEAYAILSRHGPRRLLAHVLNSLGTACFSRGDYTDALRLYLASIAVHRENGQRDKLAQALSNAGQTYAALGQSERALSFLRKAVEVLAALGARTGGADAHVALAELYAQRGEVELALAELERARADAEATGARYDLVRLKLGEAQVAIARGEFRAARAAAEEAEHIATDAGLVVYAIHARAHAAEACATSGDRAAARRYVEAVLGDARLADPARVERGDLVLAACERALRALGESARADALAVIKQRRGIGGVGATGGAGPSPGAVGGTAGGVAT